MKNYYKVLNVDPLSSTDDIKKAYREQVKRYHPDVNHSEDAEQMIRDINEAYAVLSSPVRRREYDNELKSLLSNPAAGANHAGEQHQENRTRRTRRARNKSNFVGRLQIDKHILYAVLGFCAVCVVGLSLLLWQLHYAFSDRTKDGLMPGITENKVIDLYGVPDSIESNKITYGTATVILSDGLVAHWYDAFGIFNIDNRDIDDISEIMIGENLDRIFQRYGFPDTYAEAFVVYNDVVIYYDHNRIVSAIEKLD